jgi:serine/threonine protein kinase/Tfp pilus assembly protein PilF
MNQQPDDPAAESERLQQLFARAIEFPEAERDAFLDRECAGQPQLRERIRRLLGADAEAGRFMAGASASRAAPESATTETKSVDPNAGAILGSIGRYKLLQIIGEGGFGTVYMAEQSEPIRRRVAVKIIKLGMDTRAVITRFDAERQALAMMDHSNIARVFDAGATDNGRPYFVMELVDGVPLTQYCDAHRLTARERIELFIPICQAVQHAHQKGIIHRDLKPSNVLVTLHDGVAVPKVIDFGIAKATLARLTERTMFTELRQMIGTPQYMSPEQAEMSGLDIDTRSDIYSLGVMLYELLTGTTPLEPTELRNQAYAEMQRWILEVDPPVPSARVSKLSKTDSTIATQRRTVFRQLERTISGDLDWVVMKCLEKQRSRRYESAAGLAADLSRYLLDEPVSAARPSQFYRLRKYVRRHRLAVSLVTLAAMSLIAGTTASTVLWIRASHQRAIAEQRQIQAQQSEQRAGRQAAIARAVNDVLRQMLVKANPRASLGHPMTVVDALNATIAELDRGVLTDQPLVEASVRYTIGGTIETLGEYVLAEKQLRIAVDLQRRNGDPTGGADLALYTGGLATAVAAQGRLADAEPMLRQALAMERKDLSPNDPELAEVLSSLGLILEYQNKLNEAEPLFREALAIDRGVPPPGSPNLARSLNNMADLFVNQGKPADAEPLFREGLALQRSTLPKGHPDIAIILRNLAVVEEKQGRLQDAEGMLREALEISTHALPPGHPDIARDAYSLAQCLEKEGQPDEAEKKYRQALEIVRQAPPGDSHIALVVNALAALLEHQGRQTDADQLRRKYGVLR